MTTSEFYGPAAEADLGDPAADPVLTVRMQPPDTQARRLDLDTPRAVKMDASPWPWATSDPHRTEPHGDGLWLTHDQVADWPVVHAVSTGAAQRLAQTHTAAAPPAPAPAAERTGCPDDGACHHRCGALPCFRVLHAEPLSAAHYPGDRWPDDVVAAERARADAIPGASGRLRTADEDERPFR